MTIFEEMRLPKYDYLRAQIKLAREYNAPNLDNLLLVYSEPNKDNAYHIAWKKHHISYRNLQLLLALYGWN